MYRLLIMRNVDQVRCDESGINAHFDGASGAFTAEPPDGEAKSGGPSIDQVIRQTHYSDGLPAGMVPTLVGGTFFRRSRISRYIHSYNLDGTIGGDFDILFVRSTDNGVTWTDAMALNTNASSDSRNDFRSQLTTDSAGDWVP